MPRGNLVAMLLVPLAISVAIYGFAVGVMNLPPRAWAIVAIVFCAGNWLLIGLALRRAGLVVGGVDLGAPVPRPLSVAARIGGTLFRMAGGLTATAVAVWLIARGDRRGWMFLVIALAFVAIRGWWLTRSRHTT
jgi:hypothetical protein